MKQIQKLEYRNIVSFDTETDTTGCKLKCICLYDYKIDETETFFDIDSFMSYVLSRYEIIYAYNLSFDLRLFTRYFNRFHAKLNFVEAGSKILSLKIQYGKNKTFEFRDFYAYCHTSLEQACKGFNVPTKKYPVFESDSENWKQFFETCSMDELIKHCKNDCKMLSELINNYRDIVFEMYKVDSLHKNIFSVASLSMKILRTNFMSMEIVNGFFKMIENKLEINLGLYNFVRSSYHGGYSGITTQEKLYEVVSFDVNSMYGSSSIGVNFPTGTGCFCYHRKEFELKTRIIPGFVECKINFVAGKMFLPVLKPDGKFGKFVGEWCGVITSFEYYFLKSYDIQIEFIKGVYFRTYDTSRCVEKFTLKNYDLKQKSEGGMKTFAKYCLNSLTGKYGQKAFYEKKEIVSITDTEPDNDNENLEIIDSKIGFVALRQFTQENFKSFMFVSWISLITAKSRIKLTIAIVENKAKLFDTDSIYCLKCDAKIPFDKEEKRLGEWKFEYEFSEFRARAKKTYCGIEDNKTFVRLKGIHISTKLEKEQAYQKLMNDESEQLEFEQIRFTSIRSSIKAKHTSNFDSETFAMSNNIAEKIHPQVDY
jgi:hypothetical protein